METVKLNNDLECPVIGIGTYMLSPADAENSVREALKMRYSLVDTANAYVNERAVGRGMKASGVKREGIFLTQMLRNETGLPWFWSMIAPVLLSECGKRRHQPVRPWNGNESCTRTPLKNTVTEPGSTSLFPS